MPTSLDGIAFDGGEQIDDLLSYWITNNSHPVEYYIEAGVNGPRVEFDTNRHGVRTEVRLYVGRVWLQTTWTYREVLAQALGMTNDIPIGILADCAMERGLWEGSNFEREYCNYKSRDVSYHDVVRSGGWLTK